MSIRGELWVERLGVMPYAPALDFQREVARARIAGTISEDVLLLVEHPPVVTLGRSAKKQHLLASPELLATRGVEQFEVERGGDVTFHGPGQLVGYPIIDLKRHRRDLHWYLRQVEEALIVALDDFGIAGERSKGQTGVWTQGRKIASIGVHARDWVTWHGFALNVTTDLSYFDLMVPCGIQSVVMTSISREMRELREMGSDSISSIANVTMKQVEASVVESFGSVFELAPRDVAHLLGEAITPA
jgi:lipoyl(octanoyl) transferase